MYKWREKKKNEQVLLNTRPKADQSADPKQDQLSKASSWRLANFNQDIIYKSLRETLS